CESLIRLFRIKKYAYPGTAVMGIKIIQSDSTGNGSFGLECDQQTELTALIYIVIRLLNVLTQGVFGKRTERAAILPQTTVVFPSIQTFQVFRLGSAQTHEYVF